MAFEDLSTRLQVVADRALNLCRTEYGCNREKVNQAINSSLGWRPTFHFKQSSAIIFVVEVTDQIYPEIIKLNNADILNDVQPIKVYSAVPHEVYLTHSYQSEIATLELHGIGLITVDENSMATEKNIACPLPQHISLKIFNDSVKSLPPKVRTGFRSAYRTYKINLGQGLQEAGQIVEAIIVNMANGAVKSGKCNSDILNKSAALMLDDLWVAYQNYRAVLGGARDFINQYRNVASHPQRSMKQMKDKILKCKSGFMDAVRHSNSLIDACRKEKITIRISIN